MSFEHQIRMLLLQLRLRLALEQLDRNLARLDLLRSVVVTYPKTTT